MWKKFRTESYESIYHEKWRIFSSVRRDKNYDELEKFKMIFKTQLAEMEENNSKKDLPIFSSFFAFVIACLAFSLSDVQPKPQIGPKDYLIILRVVSAVVVLFTIFY